MPRYDVPRGEDSEYEPGSNRLVLRNLLHVVDPLEMDLLEAQALMRAQRAFFQALDLDSAITAKSLLRMHGRWLGGIYPFAGKLRTIDIGKGNVWFASVQFLAGTFEWFEREILLKFTPCRAASLEEAAAQIAEVHGEFIAVHPFREGNGRLGRWIAATMAAQSGLPAPFYAFEADDSTGTRGDYMTAVMRSVTAANHSLLTQFFEQALKRGLQVEGSNPPQ